MKKFFVAICSLMLLIVLSGCNKSSEESKKNIDESKDTSSAVQGIEGIDQLKGDWKFWLDFYSSDREKNHIHRFFNMNVTEDGKVILTYENNDTIDQTIEDLSKVDRIKNNAFKLTATFKINMDESNLSDTYENNTILFDNIEESDGPWGWDTGFALKYSDNKSDTSFYVADLVEVSMDAYYSKSDAKERLIDFEDENVKAAISEGFLQIEENTNNQIKYKYTASKENPLEIRKINFAIDNNKLALLTITNDLLAINVDDWSNIGNITTVLRAGLNSDDLRKTQEELSEKDSEKKESKEEKKVANISELPKTEVDRRILALFKKLYNQEDTDQITVLTNDIESEIISGSIGFMQNNFEGDFLASLELSQNGDVTFTNDLGNAMGVSESKSGNIISDLTEDEWKNIRENVTISKLEEIVPKFFGKWSNGFGDPSRGVHFTWNDKYVIESIGFSFEGTSDIYIESIFVKDDNQISVMVSELGKMYSNPHTFELKLIDKNTMEFLLLSKDYDGGDDYERLKEVLTKD